MRRVVVTGMGIISSIGNDVDEVTRSLRDARSGITFAEPYHQMGFRCQVHGSVKIDIENAIDRRARRFMGDGAAYNFLAMEQAIADSGLEEKDIVNPRTGLIMGSGGPSTRAIVAAADTARSEPVKGPKRVGPFVVPKAMSSTCSAVLSTWYRIKGVNYSITSACSTSAHCIGNAGELIRWGKQDIVFAGGGEELDWTLSVLFDAMGAMSSHYNATPERASRAFDKNRDGFVISGGGGVVVLDSEVALMGGGEHGRRGVDAEDDGSGGGELFGEGAVAAAEIEDGLTGLGVEQIDDPAGEVGDEAAVGGVGFGVPCLTCFCW